MLHVVFLINRVTTPLLLHKSPYHVLYEKVPDSNSFKVFGCLCFASTIHSHRTKLQSRARKSIFLGYQSGYKGYIRLDMHSRAIFFLEMSHFMKLCYLTKIYLPHLILTIAITLPLHLLLLLMFLTPLYHPYHPIPHLHHLSFLTLLLEPPLEIKLCHLISMTMFVLLLIICIHLILIIPFQLIRPMLTYYMLILILLCRFTSTMSPKPSLKQTSMIVGRNYAR